MNQKLKVCIFVILLGIIGIIVYFTLNVNIEFNDENVPIIRKAVEFRIPTDEDLKNLKQEMEEVKSYLEGNQLEKTEIQLMYQNVQSAIVCSEANRDFNTLEEKYLEYVERSDEIQSKIVELEQKYNEYLTLVDNIPKFSATHRMNAQKSLEEVIRPIYTSICEQKENYILEREELDTIYISAKKIADDFFEKDYELMCHIVNAEAGSLNYSSVAHLYTAEEIEEMKTMERCKVARIIELRAKHPAFKQNNVRDVIYAPGQYSTVTSGAINQEPNSQTRSDMKRFLRGHIDTGLPENVVYQALFKQGSGVYEHTPSGHYFCYH